MQPAAARRAHRTACLEPQRGGRAFRGPGRRRRAHDLLRAQPAGGGAHLPVRQGRLDDPDPRTAIAPYRAGYTPQQRREIERRLAEGELLGVVATSALELGIDIGHLDAAISVTFPGTVASLRQQWGRAGRRRGGLALYVAGDDALDQFFCRHPEEFLERPVEAAILDHPSELIYMRHLLAAAYEAPLEAGRPESLGEGLEETADRLVAAGELRRHGGRWLPRRAGFPAGQVSLRSASPDSFTIVEAEEGELLGFVEAERAFSTVHPGAVYLHLGEPYEVEELDIDGRPALVRPRRRRLLHAAEDRDRDLHRGERDARDALGVELAFGVVSVRSRWSPTSASASPTTR